MLVKQRIVLQKLFFLLFTLFELVIQSGKFPLFANFCFVLRNSCLHCFIWLFQSCCLNDAVPVQDNIPVILPSNANLIVNLLARRLTTSNKR